MIESSSSTKTPKRTRPNKAVEHLNIQVISYWGAKTITKVVKELLDPSVELTTDDSTSYIKFDKLSGSHKSITSSKEAVKVFLPWHILQLAMPKSFYWTFIISLKTNIYNTI